MIWRIADIDEGRTYVLALCHSLSGNRTFHLMERGSTRPLDAVAITQSVPSAMLRKRSLGAIADKVLLESGERFYVDPHNIWLLHSEVMQLSNRDFNEVIWSTPTPPRFPPA